MKTKGIILIGIVIALLIGFSSAYIVDETEQVVVTQFGKVVGTPKTEPGLYFRIPFIQVPNLLPKNLLEWDGDPGQIPTMEKTYIWVDTFARWKIVDPIKFLESVQDLSSAQGRLDEIIDPAVRNFITSNKLIEAVRKSNREMDIVEMGMDPTAQDKHKTTYSISTGRDKITEGIMEQAIPKMAKFGIEVVDVKIKRINYVEEVRSPFMAA